MSRKTNIPQSNSAKEYGRRLYVSDANYRDQVRATTDKGIFDQKLQKQSEFKKPYMSDDFQEMEYFFPDINIPIPDGPTNPLDITTDVPWMGETFPDAEEMPDGPWHVTFFCGGDGCFCPGQTKCFDIKCSFPVTNVEVITGRGFSVSGSRSYICLTASDDPSLMCGIIVTMRAPVTRKDGAPVFGINRLIFTECDEKDCCDCSGSESIGYSTLEMATSATQNLTVVGATALADCYEWSTSSGSLSAETGLSTVLTAPSSNAECASNPTISLSCAGTFLGSITIAVNDPAAGGYLALYVSESCGFCDGFWGCWNGSIASTSYLCNGSVSGTTGCSSNFTTSEICVASGQCGISIDIRSDAAKTAGCCPEEAL